MLRLLIVQERIKVLGFISDKKRVLSLRPSSDCKHTVPKRTAGLKWEDSDKTAHLCLYESQFAICESKMGGGRAGRRGGLTRVHLARSLKEWSLNATPVVLMTVFITLSVNFSVILIQSEGDYERLRAMEQRLRLKRIPPRTQPARIAGRAKPSELQQLLLFKHIILVDSVG